MVRRTAGYPPGRAHWDPLDFEARPGVPDSGWPFDSEHLTPYYGRAHRVLGLGPFDYDAASWEKERSRLPLDPAHVVTTMFRFGPLDVVLRRRQRLVDGEDVQVYVHATAQELVADDLGSRVAAVSVASGPARRFTVRAQLFVLAAGGIDNPRLLLLSTGAQPQGLGNGHDLVGRYFMEHPHTRTGMLRLQGAARHLDMSLRRRRSFPDATVQATLTPAPHVVRARSLLNSTWWLRPIPAALTSPAAAALSAFREGVNPPRPRATRARAPPNARVTPGGHRSVRR